jgi:hypothetical protein
MPNRGGGPIVRVATQLEGGKTVSHTDISGFEAAMENEDASE